MSLNYEVLYKHFPNDKINGIAEGVLSRIDDDEWKNDPYDALQCAMDDELIYTEDQWTMIEQYCTPQDANFDTAWELFQEDLCTAINDGVFEQEGEEEE